MVNRFKVTTPPTHFDDFDGSSKLSLFDKENPDKNLFNLVDDELIKLGGSQVLLYKYCPSEDIDDVYMETRQKAIATEPIEIYGSYDPRPIEEELTQFGVEIQNDQIFTFNKSYIERRLGRSIIVGDIIKPVFQNMKFEVYQVVEDSFEAYGVYHLMVYTKLLRGEDFVLNETLYDTTPKEGGV